MTRPMLAFALGTKAPLDKELGSLRWPLWASPKLDGIRALAIGGQLFSRTGKLIPNRFAQSVAAAGRWHGQDGELCIGPLADGLLYDRTRRGIMTLAGDPDFYYQVFDNWAAVGPFTKRLTELAPQGGRIRLLPQTLVASPDDLLLVEQDFVTFGFEGIILRTPAAPYKNGRSTLREAGLMKLKRFQDDEAEIVGTYERQHNDNPAERSPLGFAARSTSGSGLRPAGDLGGLHCVVTTGLFCGARVDLGGAYSAEQRRALWAARAALPGRVVTFKHFSYGATDAPRFPIFKDFRDD